MISSAASDPAAIRWTTSASSVGPARPFIVRYVPSRPSVFPALRQGDSLPRPGSGPRSPGPGRAVPDAGERAGREVRLLAGHPGGPTTRIVRRPCRQLQPVARGELDGGGRRREPEPDRSALDDDDLVVGMVVGRVAIARSVRPARRVEPVGAQPVDESCGIASAGGRDADDASRSRRSRARRPARSRAGGGPRR